MKVTTRLLAAAALALPTLAAAGCEAQKSSNPLSPSVAGPIAGVTITVPQLLEPGQGFKYKAAQQPIRLLVANATTTGVRPLTYTFEVATDSGFATKIFARAGVPPGDAGKTSLTADKLELGRTYYWRARAEDGANSGDFAIAQFEILPTPILVAPVPLSPINDVRITTRRPALVVTNSERNAGVGALTYEFQVARDVAFTQLVAAGRVSESPQPSWTVDVDIADSLQYFWRARASDGDTTSTWSVTTSFRGPAAAPGPGPGPSPGPSPGTCALGNGPAIIECISVKYADKRVPVATLEERQENMKFLRDRIIEAGKCSGLDYGWNLKRGGPELSIDVIAWKRPDGNMGVDIGYDYDNISTTLRLVWSEVDLFASYTPYPAVSCGGV